MKLITCLLLFISTLVTAQQSLAPRLDSLFGSYFKNNEPGGAVLIAREGKIIYQNGFGIADINSNEVITVNTLFNVGSITKTFVAYGILQLAKQGKLSLDDDLLKYFPDFRNAAIAHRVKLHHLLTHTSGLPDSRKVSEQHDFYLTAKDEENWAPIKQTDSLLFRPGTRYRYSNPAFNGLALIIERVTGKKWQDYIAEIIFKPAGMTTSTITDGSHPDKFVSHGYVKNRKGGFDELDYGEEPTFAAAGNGGVWSSVSELWKYEQAIQQHLFLDSEWIDRSRKVFPYEGWTDLTASHLGLSWFIQADHGTAMVGHTGSQGGFISDYCWWPEKKLFYVLLCNTSVSLKEIRDKVVEAVGP